jgi:hypothetical protein
VPVGGARQTRGWAAELVALRVVMTNGDLQAERFPDGPQTGHHVGDVLLECDAEVLGAAQQLVAGNLAGEALSFIFLTTARGSTSSRLRFGRTYVTAITKPLSSSQA